MQEAADYLAALNPSQLAAVKHDGSSLLILAGAGSGKTRVITTKIAYLIKEKHIDPYAILAVTFTKKAANEMKERAVALEPRAEYAQIRTFHSWGAYFLRAHAEAAGISKNFTVYDDDDMVTLLGKAVPSLSRQQAALAAHKISLAKDYCCTPDSERLCTMTRSLRTSMRPMKSACAKPAMLISATLSCFPTLCCGTTARSAMQCTCATA